MLRAIVLLVLFLAGCFSAPGKVERVPVVATHSIIGDVVREVGGEAIELLVLLPPGTDPHSYEPTPQDLVKASQARIVFFNGAGLEEAFLERLLRSASPDATVVDLSEGIELLSFEGHEKHEVDPHVWLDPSNVIVWAHHIASVLEKVDPKNAEFYRKNAQDYEKRLRELDAWIWRMVEGIPEERRKLVTDHLALSYFARRYGFRRAGTIIPGVTTLAEPSAQHMAEFVDLIKKEGVPAIFVSASANPKIAEWIAQDTGVKVVPLYIESLSQPDGPALTYIELMRYNVSAIAEALK